MSRKVEKKDMTYRNIKRRKENTDPLLEKKKGK